MADEGRNPVDIVVIDPTIPSGGALVVGPEQITLLKSLEAKALQPENIVEVAELAHQIETLEGKRVHMDRMNDQTVDIPFGYRVTFSVERQPKLGLCRHMSMSSARKDRVPRPEAVTMVMEHLGFWGTFKDCAIWFEYLTRDASGEKYRAVNVVQAVRS